MTTETNTPSSMASQIEEVRDESRAYDLLRTVFDPETNLNIVDMGLIYAVKVQEKRPYIKITYTLTTPGCPLASVIQTMIWEAFAGWQPEFQPKYDMMLDLTFDPPWTPELLSEEAKAELGL